MRIIAGSLKGRRLAAPTWPGLRPTSDKLRETLFNILGARIEGAHVLDLFAGTGAVGLEALSRGAAHVVGVDSDRRAAALIARNVTACGRAADYTIHSGDVMAVLSRMRPERAFDIVFLDPPYAFTGTRDVMAAAATHLSPEGVLVLERATRVEPEVPDALARVRDVRSGDSSLTLLVRRPETL
jgi:16S rRNA (guanine(966)-N(2))-methyltransferase RsmD